MKLKYLPANQAWVFMLGDTIVSIDGISLFGSRKLAVWRANFRGLEVDQFNNVNQV
jgi:hypothetical protein